MSVQTGSATNLADLFAKLVTFLTQTGSGKPGWVQVATVAANGATPYTMASGQNQCVAQVHLRAPGVSGTESLYMNLRAFQGLSADRFNIELRGASGYLVSSTFEGQPLTSPPNYVYLWNQAMPYWFVANGQRCVVVVKVQNTYQSFYIGKILPYGTPGEYPFPLFIGGMGIDESIRFSQSDRLLSAFWDPVASYLQYPDGTWVAISNWQHQSADGATNTNNVWPWQYDAQNRPTWMADNLDGTFTTFGGRIECTFPSINVVGEFDGVAFVTGFENSSESTIAIGDDSYLVVPNGFRSGQADYAAILLA